MEMLTLKRLKEMKPGVFAFGFDKSETGRNFMWVASRGSIHDWAIYTTLGSVPRADFWAMGNKEGIRKHGQKLQDGEKIQLLVPCNQEAFAMYRH